MGRGREWNIWGLQVTVMLGRVGYLVVGGLRPGPKGKRSPLSAGCIPPGGGADGGAAKGLGRPPTSSGGVGGFAFCVVFFFTNLGPLKMFCD